MIKAAETENANLLEEFSAAGLLGPRQAGKITLAEEIAKTQPEPFISTWKTRLIRQNCARIRINM